ncbi:MAG: 50S ribosomal protein L31e [Candidatus Baldrarchaeia archaeon]
MEEAGSAGAEVVKEERIYVIPLAKKFICVSRRKRAKKAINAIKEFIKRHMKAKEVKIDTKLNEKIWERGIQKPPRKIKVRAQKTEDDVVTVYLAEG